MRKGRGVVGEGAPTRAFARFDRLVPESLRSDPYALVRARLVVGFSCTWLFIGNFFAVVYFLCDARVVAAGLFALALTSPAPWFALTWTQRLQAAAHVMATQLMIGVTLVAYFAGGTDSATLMYLVIIPMVVIFIDGLAGGTIWLGITTAGAVALHALEAMGYPFPTDALQRPDWLNVVALVYLMIIIVAFSAGDHILKQHALSSVEDARRVAERASAAKSIFLANMSHELRTPMNGVIGGADLLDMTELGKDQRDLIHMIRASGKSLLAIIDDILDLAKIESSRLVLERAPFNLRDALDDLAAFLAPNARKKSVAFSVDVDDSVPAVVEGDVVRLKQIVTNLVSNAIKFTQSGSVEVRAWGEGDRVSFSVRDTGIGIAPDRLEHIFEPFIQEDSSTSRRFGGTGLGLTISRQLVAAHEGELAVVSTVGEGTCFTFDLLLPAVGAPEPTESDDVEAESHLLDVLVVEDNAVNQAVCRRMLEKLGHRCRMAGDGLEALKALESNIAVDVVLMDCQMPRLDGYEATERIRERPWRHRDVPIVALTANALARDRKRCEDAGMDAFISKPVKMAELSDVLQRSARRAKRAMARATR